MSKSWKRDRRQRLMALAGDAEFREMVVGLAEAVSASGVELPGQVIAYLADVNQVKADVPRPKPPPGNKKRSGRRRR